MAFSCYTSAPMKIKIAMGVVLSLVAIACGDRERIAKLEKQNQELQARLEQLHTGVDLDLQKKCSDASEQWFNGHWSRDKDTLLLNYQNHYDRKMGQCFELVEYHYNETRNGGSWYNDMGLWNVFENARVAGFVEYHFIDPKLNIAPQTRVYKCKVFGNDCKTLDEFNSQVSKYLND